MNIKNADTTTLKGVVIPEAFKEPSWVQREFDAFKKGVVQDYQKNKMINTKLVRALFKEHILGGKVQPNYPLDKGNVGKLMEKMYTAFGDTEFQWYYMLVYKAGFFLSTFTGTSFTPEALVLPTQFKKKRAKIIEEYNEMKIKDASKAVMFVDKAFKELTEEVLTHFRENREKYPIIDSIDSGAKGGPDDLRKLLVAIGLSINAKNEINDVVDHSHSESLTPTQFFNYTSQAIVSQYKKSSETAIPGYLIRQLNTIMVGVKLSSTIDCGTKGFLGVKILTKELLQSMQGKLYKDGGSLSELNSKDLELVGKTIYLRSPLYCKAQDGICHTCYNPAFIEKMNLTENAGIGLLSSTAQAGLLTNMTLKAAHTGLSLDKAEVDLSKDIYTYSD